MLREALVHANTEHNELLQIGWTFLSSQFVLERLRKTLPEGGGQGLVIPIRLRSNGAKFQSVPGHWAIPLGDVKKGRGSRHSTPRSVEDPTKFLGKSSDILCEVGPLLPDGRSPGQGITCEKGNNVGNFGPCRRETGECHLELDKTLV
ncbi:hypothetical protein FKM82_022690 [Ascaphus truei]